MAQPCVSRILVPLVLSLLPVCSFAKTVVFWQPGFPVADSSAPNEADCVRPLLARGLRMWPICRCLGRRGH